MHVLTFVLQMPNVPNEAVEEDAILNELRLADFVNELPVQDTHFKELANLLGKHFGMENLATDSSNRTITIKKDGIVRYFINLRARIKKAIDLAMDKPIEDFIYLRGESDWYAIENMLSDPFDTQFYVDYGLGCGSATVFAHNLYNWMGYKETDEITMELTQVFDVHY